LDYLGLVDLDVVQTRTKFDWRKVEMKNTKSLLLVIMLMAMIISVIGCRKPYDTPEYKEIKNNETAFVIPLEGKTSNQGQFASAAYLAKLQVATKRIQITHRWNQTGRRGYKGEWIDAIKVITVDRAPVTRQWTTDAGTGTSNKDEAIWVESKDSVEFAVGFSCSAYVEEANAALYLYNYPATSLANNMDTEIRARIQSVAADKCGEYDLDELRGKKKEVIEAVRTDVTNFFSKKGITVTTVGMFGGFKYKNTEIQTAIDNVFKAQQLEDVELAKKKAALVSKETIEINADAEAARIDKIAAAEAAKIEKINAAAEKAQQNPLFLQLRQLDVEEKRIAKWDGQFPNWYMGGDMAGTNPNLLLSVGTDSK
jgi:regulator of protease activity HflC (stomatin/prohibitin superfamily)